MRRKNISSEMMMDYISQALLLLMRTTPFSAITIGELTKKAGVNRSTYYRHFTSKEAVLRYYLASVMEEYQTRFAAGGSREYRFYLETMFESFYARRSDLLLIHRAGLSHLLMDVLMECFRFKDLPEAEQYRASYHIGGIYSNLLLWFSRDMRESPKEMTELALRIRPEKSLTLFGSLSASP